MNSDSSYNEEMTREKDDKRRRPNISKIEQKKDFSELGQRSNKRSLV